MSLTIERLRQAVAYNQETGEFTRGDKRAGTIDEDGYLRIRIDRRTYRAHRLAWFYVHGVWPSDQVDHKDRNRLNNAIDNLEDKTQSLNGVNRGVFKNSKTGVKGVSFDKRRGTYRAYSKVNGAYVNLGSYKSVGEASTAYQRFTEARDAVHTLC